MALLGSGYTAPTLLDSSNKDLGVLLPNKVGSNIPGTSFSVHWHKKAKLLRENHSLKYSDNCTVSPGASVFPTPRK